MKDRVRGLLDLLFAIGIAALVAVAIVLGAARLGPLYPAERAQMLAGGWALIAVAGFVGCSLAREGGVAARIAGAVAVDALAVEAYALLVPYSLWYGARRMPDLAAAHGMAGGFALFRDFLGTTMVAGLAAACAGLGFALWRPNRGTAAAAGLILLVLGAAFGAALIGQGRAGETI